jgi:hypothetical protein
VRSYAVAALLARNHVMTALHRWFVQTKAVPLFSEGLFYYLVSSFGVHFDNIGWVI